MKASDTVMTKEEILKIRGNDNSFEPVDIKRIKRLNKYIKRQAEISFTAGIKEVVEWIKDNSFEEEYTQCYDDGVPVMSKRLCIQGDWQSKLKEWGCL